MTTQVKCATPLYLLRGTCGDQPRRRMWASPPAGKIHPPHTTTPKSLWPEAPLLSRRPLEPLFPLRHVLLTRGPKFPDDRPLLQPLWASFAFASSMRYFEVLRRGEDWWDMCRSVTAAMAEYLPCLTAVALLGTRGLIRNSFIRLNAMICNSVAYSRKKKDNGGSQSWRGRKEIGGRRRRHEGQPKRCRSGGGWVTR